MHVVGEYAAAEVFLEIVNKPINHKLSYKSAKKCVYRVGRACMCTERTKSSQTRLWVDIYSLCMLQLCMVFAIFTIANLTLRESEYS